MKKIRFDKLKKSEKKTAPKGRITNETVAEHREHILAGGRRFKYPLQYARHKLVINTVLVSTTAIIALVLLGWWQLYVVQNTSEFFYRVTQVVRVPVASIDGANVRYSDYMLYYRPSEYYLNKYDEIKSDSDDGKLQLEYKKRDAMDRAEADAIARRIAEEKQLSVSADEVDQALAALRNADNGMLSEEAVRSSAQRVFGMTEQDTRDQYRNSLMRGKAAFAIDDHAREVSEDVSSRLSQKKSSMSKIAAAINKSEKGTVEYGMSGLVSNTMVFNGVQVKQIASLDKGVSSGPIKSFTDDGYLFVRVLEKNDRQVNFEFIQVPLKEFTKRVSNYRSNSQVNEYITIDPDKYMKSSESQN